jgi:hypothetical protein
MTVFDRSNLCCFDKSICGAHFFLGVPYVRVGFSKQVPKSNFYIRFLEVYIILNQSQDAMWHFLTKFN